MSIFSIGAILVGLSALFGYINYRVLHLPHTIGLVVIALAASLSIIAFDLIEPSMQIGQRVTGVLHRIDFNETLMHGLLSFLLFAGALHADFSAFKARRLTIGVMARLGTLISNFAIGAATWARPRSQNYFFLRRSAARSWDWLPAISGTARCTGSTRRALKF